MTAVVVCRSSVGGSPIIAARKTPPVRGSSPAAGTTRARLATSNRTTARIRAPFNRERPGMARIIAERSAARYSRPASRPLVEPMQQPAAHVFFEHAERAVILPEREEAIERHPERATEQRAVGAAVGHDRDRA